MVDFFSSPNRAPAVREWKNFAFLAGVLVSDRMEPGFGHRTFRRRKSLGAKVLFARRRLGGCVSRFQAKNIFSNVNHCAQTGSFLQSACGATKSGRVEGPSFRDTTEMWVSRAPATLLRQNQQQSPIAIIDARETRLPSPESAALDRISGAVKPIEKSAHHGKQPTDFSKRGQPASKSERWPHRSANSALPVRFFFDRGPRIARIEQRSFLTSYSPHLAGRIPP